MGVGDGIGEGTGEGKGAAELCPGILWAILWFFGILFTMWLAGILFFFYIIFLPFSACIAPCKGICEALLKIIQLPLMCAENMMGMKPLC